MKLAQSFNRMMWLGMLLASTWGAFDGVAQAQETKMLPRITDNVARKTAFEARNSPANLEQAGRELLARTYIGTWHPHEFNRPFGWERLKEVRAQIDRKEFAGALDNFKIYTLEKLRDIDSEGLPRGRFDPFSSGINGVQWIRPLIDVNQKADILAQADELLGGVIRINNQKWNIGAAGSVNWKAASENANRGANGWPWDIDAFYPLLSAYILTGDAKYMNGWAAYADDWAMNQRDGIGQTNIADVPDQWANGVETMLTLLRYLGGVTMLPDGAQRLPSGTFARVFTRMVDDFIPISILYHRSNPQNWNDTSLTALPDVGFFLQDYPIGRQLLQESKRRLELLFSTHHLPDGTDLDTTVGYSHLLLVGAGTFLERINTRQMRVPEWMLTQWEKADWRNNPDLPQWQQKTHQEMLKRARFLVAHLMANGEFPIGGTRNGRHNESQLIYNTLNYFLPDAFQNPDIANILALTSGRRAAGKPSFTSERFPYTGHTYIRAGWKPDDAYGYLYAAPTPLGGSLSWRNNNAFGLSAFGYDLLETGDNGVYDQPHSPVKVDGQEQFFHFGIPTWGHRGAMLTSSVLNTPPPWRWHDSPHFTVAEGIYAGNFGRDKPLNDVRHQRVAQFVRGTGLWIVTDRLQSPQPHTYTLDWRFGIQPGDKRDFTVEQIKVEAATNSIKTARPDGANVSLYQFPSAPLTFSTNQDRTPPQGYRLHDFLRVGGEWKASGQSTVVTLIFPRQNEQSELKNIKALNSAVARGFEATTPDGARILYQAATVAPAKLQTGSISANAEALLLCIDKNGARRGVVLGAQSLLIAGKTNAIPSANFEFAVNGATLKTTPIHTPLAPVEIAPDTTTAFVDKQIVTLRCATPRAQIRYTLDGGEPTLDSPLYRGPITLTASTEVKARSVRAGITKMPTTMSGTDASIVSEATFVQTTPSKAIAATDTVLGLRYELYEGRWQDLLSGLDHLQPQQSGVAAKLFDFPDKTNAPIYAYKYSGFFDAPADGVYNFVAPPEWYQPNIMAAYELRLMLDGKEWVPATSRHALGVWSVALQRGKHDFQLYFADLRADGVAKMNKPNQPPLVWNGTAPDIQISGPNLPRTSLASLNFSHAK